jgi:hypothetical protein
MAYSPPEARRWYDHPAINLAGLIVGVVGLALYLTSQKSRQLEFYVSPDWAVVVKSGFSDLHVLYQNHEIKEDVTAAQVTIWNAGYQPITQDAVLSPVAIVTEPKVKILSATVRRVTRDVITFQTDQKLLPTSVVPLSWKILEHGDGAVVQVIYLGDPRVKVKLTGIIEGQSPIRGVEFWGTIKSPSEQMKNDKYLNYLVLVVSVAALLMARSMVLDFWRGPARIGRPLAILFACFSVFIAGTAVLIVYHLLSQPSLPFS